VDFLDKKPPEPMPLSVKLVFETPALSLTGVLAQPAVVDATRFVNTKFRHH
jgi:hypothetical protein